MDYSTVSMWEILVPTRRRSDDKPITTRFHRAWDAKVRKISGGLTIMPPAKGQWVAPHDASEDAGKLFVERMIPVRFLATREQMEEIVDMTAVEYDQLAVLCYMVGTNVVMRTLDEAKLNRKIRKRSRK